MTGAPTRFAAFFTTLPGVLTGVAAVVTALAGAWAVLAPRPAPPPAAPILLRAVEFANGPDVAPAQRTSAPREFGDVLMNREPPDNDRPNWAEWNFVSRAGGAYLLRIEYAAGEPRPLTVLVNGEIAIPVALNAVTGCWEARCQAWRDVGVVSLRRGANLLRLDRPEGVFPHIRFLELRPTE
jgi:hypothetical protein